ncbi:MAG: VanW family protein [Clostridia bacterium]|nr:VanW family protein [Clostridia bacterium]
MNKAARKPSDKAQTSAKRSGARTGARAAAAKGAKAATRRTGGAQANPVATARKRQAVQARARDAERRAARCDVGQEADLFMDARPATAINSGKRPPRGYGAVFGMLNVCLMIGIAVLVAMGVRQQVAYADFVQMRDVVDQQTFYDGTTIEGVDVSRMTLANAMDYWGERVEARYANRTVMLDNGLSVTAGQLGYASDYASVLSAAWSAGRSGTLEERYHSASGRRENPVAYSVSRVDFDEKTLDAFVARVAEETNRPVREAGIERFDVDTYEFVFTEAEPGRELDTAALKSDIISTLRAGGGSVGLKVNAVKPAVSTTEVAAGYGLIDYAITNASSSSKARLNNIKLAMSIINGTRVAPGETFSFNAAVGQRTTERGFRKATAYSGGDITEQVGGGICQVSTTLFNAAVKADMEIVERHNHSLTVGYVDKGKDATVSWGSQDFKFKNTSSDDIYICCYLTEDKRVRFGIFGKLLPDGETITLDAVTTEAIKYETQYKKTPLLAPGQTNLLQAGRNGYKAEAYKVRWDALGNEISRELLCKSYYKEKDEIIQYGA